MINPDVSKLLPQLQVVSTVTPSLLRHTVSPQMVSPDKSYFPEVILDRYFVIAMRKVTNTLRLEENAVKIKKVTRKK